MNSGESLGKVDSRAPDWDYAFPDLLRNKLHEQGKEINRLTGEYFLEELEESGIDRDINRDRLGKIIREGYKKAFHEVTGVRSNLPDWNVG
jgi:hypothetical protein